MEKTSIQIPESRPFETDSQTTETNVAKFLGQHSSTALAGLTVKNK